jgi:hypothetical protein
MQCRNLLPVRAELGRLVMVIIEGTLIIVGQNFHGTTADGYEQMKSAWEVGGSVKRERKYIDVRIR